MPPAENVDSRPSRRRAGGNAAAETFPDINERAGRSVACISSASRSNGRLRCRRSATGCMRQRSKLAFCRLSHLSEACRRRGAHQRNRVWLQYILDCREVFPPVRFRVQDIRLFWRFPSLGFVVLLVHRFSARESVENLRTILLRSVSRIRVRGLDCPHSSHTLCLAAPGAGRRPSYRNGVSFACRLTGRGGWLVGLSDLRQRRSLK